MSNAKTYTAADIERYYSGGMTAAERHSLEKAALDDPMLADAIDGYGHTATPAADLQALQSRLQQRVNKDKRTKVLPISGQWLKVAALFIVMAGGGWLVLQTFTSENNNTATLSSEGAPTRQNISDSATTLDSALSGNKAPTTAKQTTSTTSSSDVPGTTTDAGRNDVARNQTRKPTVERTETKQDEPAMAPAVDIAIMKDNTTIGTESTAGDTTKHADMAVGGEASMPVQISGTQNQARARANKQDTGAPEPENGWAAFEKYVAANKKLPANGKPVTGNVVLSFTVGKNGRPVAVTISKSLCGLCDEEAVRLLKEGPSWRGSGARGNVTITF